MFVAHETYCHETVSLATTHCGHAWMPTGGLWAGAAGLLSDASAWILHSSHMAHQIVVAPPSWSPDTPIIPTKFLELDHDNRYIIAKQQLLERRSPGDPNDTNEQPKPDAIQYWILDI
jgi:hypothetical protein